MLTRSNPIAPLFLTLALFSQTASANEDVKVSYDEAYKVFASISEQSNALGLIDFCNLKEKHPKATDFLRKGLARLIDPSIPEDDRKMRATLLSVTVNGYAGGVAQGLTIAESQDPKFNRVELCKASDEIAKALFSGPADGP
jgi:hypothetical protein